MLAEALKTIFSAKNEIVIIGTRHGEKLYETLVTREEMVRAEDMGGYFRIPSDDRGLNYSNYFTKGEVEVSENDDYHSHNTKLLDQDELIKTLLKLDFVKHSLSDTE